MLSRHATPNTSSTTTTGITRLFGFQYCVPSMTPEVTIVTNPTMRLTRARRKPTSGRRAAGAEIRAIAGPRGFGGRAARSWCVLCARERDESRDGLDALVQGHPARHVGQRVDRDPLALRLLSRRGGVGAGVVARVGGRREQMVHHRCQVPGRDQESSGPLGPPALESIGN